MRNERPVSSSRMNCPKCLAGMNVLRADHHSDVHRCEACRGIFCSHEALASLERHWFLWPKTGTDDLDEGKSRVARLHDRLTNIRCPACEARMEQVAAPEQEHITLDRCL